MPRSMMSRGMLVRAAIACGVMSRTPARSHSMIICWKVTIASQCPYSVPSYMVVKSLPYISDPHRGPRVPDS